MITVFTARKMGAQDICDALSKRRAAAKVPAPKVWAIRRAMAGATHKRGKVETRGGKLKLTDVQAQRLFDKRSELVVSADGARYVPVDEIVTRARVPHVHRTTAARYLRSFGVAWRRMREKPPRTGAHEADRKEVCRIWRRKPATFWTDHVDLIIDAKKFPLPGSAAAAKRLRQQMVRGAMRTRQEGLSPGFTRPSLTKHKYNVGGHAHILAGICGDKVVLWEDIGGRWCGQRAADMYEGPIKAVLQKWRPGKRSWLIMEDNDPSGFNSNRGKIAKAASGMRTIDQPPYSPDLNPLDFSLWSLIEKKALAGRRRAESREGYKARLRRVALGLPRPLVRKIVEGIKSRAHAIFEADGKNISND